MRVHCEFTGARAECYTGSGRVDDLRSFPVALQASRVQKESLVAEKVALERLLEEMEEHGDLMGESRQKELEAVRLEEERKTSNLVEKVAPRTVAFA